MTAEKLKSFLKNATQSRVVTGHPAPDTDAVVSALFEAYRRTVCGVPSGPLVQDALPRETAWLLGDLAPLVPVGGVAETTKELVLTDHHDRGLYRCPVTAVVDHHPVSADTDLAGVDAEIAPVGAATTLVARRLRRDGIIPDAACARMLLGAILLDTENLSPRKAKAEDLEMAGWLSALCGVDTDALFAALQAELLAESDVTALYRRDYRRYTDRDGRPLLGWAILKVWADACPDLDAVRRLLAEDATPTRVAKIVLNDRDTAARTEYYLAAGAGADRVLDAVLAASGDTAERTAPDTAFLPETAHHWGRKRYADRLVSLLTEKS